MLRNIFLRFFLGGSIGDLFLQELNDPVPEVLFSFFFALALLVDEGVVSVLDHVLGAGILEDGHDLAPMLPVLHHVFEDAEVFLRRPLSPLLLVVEVVEPSFPAVLGRLEDLEVGVVKDVLGDLIPLAAVLLPDGLDELLVLLLSPRDFPLQFDHVETLELQELRIFVEEGKREAFPFLLRLNKGETYDLSRGNILKICIKNNKPNKDPPLVLIPSVGIVGQFTGHFIPKLTFILLGLDGLVDLLYGLAIDS